MRNGARSKSRRTRTHPHNRGETHTNQMVNKLDQLHDDLAEFEEFRATTLKAIRKDIRKGLGAAELRKKYAAVLQGRQITDALTTEDVGKAAMITKDIIDRVEGKPTEKKEVKHSFAEMSDNELDAVLKSEIEELEDMQNRFEN